MSNQICLHILVQVNLQIFFKIIFKFLRIDAPSDISYMSGTPRGLNEESGDYGANNERWK